MRLSFKWFGDSRGNYGERPLVPAAVVLPRRTGFAIEIEKSTARVEPRQSDAAAVRLDRGKRLLDFAMRGVTLVFQRGENVGDMFLSVRQCS